MMKKSFFQAAFLAGVLAVTCAGQVFAGPVTEDQAKTIAMEHAGVAPDQVSWIQTEQEMEDGQMVINVEFVTRDYGEYNYEILAGDGTVLGADYERKGVLEGDNAGGSISLEQAKEKALEHAGLEADQVTFLKEKSEQDDRRLEHKVEFYTAGFQKYEYKADAMTGEILEWDYDADSRHARQDAAIRKGQTAVAGTQTSGAAGQTTASKDGSVSLEDAKAIALKQAGLRDSQVTWGRVHKEYDDGRQIYKGEFYHDVMEYEFEVDVRTGEIVDWDVERIYD